MSSKLTYTTTLSFTRGYIAEPYWTEMAQLIDIQKQSGVNRAKSEANRRRAQEEYLKSHGMTLDDYTNLEARAKRHFHTNEDGLIIIPSDNMLSALVSFTHQLRSASRPCQPDQIRSRIESTDFVTQKTQADGFWERFAVVQSGTGGKLSNQRGFRKSAFISHFDAVGSVSFSPDFVKPDVLKNAFEWGGDNIGIGSSRKMGWGKFTVTKWEKV